MSGERMRSVGCVWEAAGGQPGPTVPHQPYRRLTGAGSLQKLCRRQPRTDHSPAAAAAERKFAGQFIQLGACTA